MPPRCRVTFFDNHHKVRRTLLINTSLPLVAAETALAWLSERYVLPEDLGPAVKVEIIRTVEQSIPLAILRRPKTRVA